MKLKLSSLVFPTLFIFSLFSQGCEASCCEEECADKTEYECDYQWCVCRCENEGDSQAVIQCVKNNSNCQTYD